MGRFFDGDACSGGGRNHHIHRDAAQQHSCDDDRGGIPRKVGGDSWEAVGGRRFLGRCGSRKTPSSFGPCGKAACLGSSAFRTERRGGICRCYRPRSPGRTPELGALKAPLLVHAELPGPIAEAEKKLTKADPRRYSAWLASRPRAAENEAIELLIKLAREVGARIHIVHLSSSDAIATLQKAKSDGHAVTVETCPHYLTFNAEDIGDGRTEFKGAPPIREKDNREKLWAALGDATIDFVATDHSPCPPAMKLLETGDFLRAWGGIASLELSLPAVWTEASSRGYAVPRLAEWLCSGPARLAGLERKGRIAVGYDADFVIWNPDGRFSVDPAKLYQRNKITPYAGREFSGVVETTFLRGRKIFDKGELSHSPLGQILRRGSA